MRTAVLLLCVVALSVSAAEAKRIAVGTFGETYRIAEPDQAEVFAEAARRNRNELERLLGELRKRAIADVTSRVASLPPNREPGTILLETDYTLPESVLFPTRNGWYHFPAGFTVNPLDHLILKPTYLIINPGRPEEISWAERIVGRSGGPVRILLAGIPDAEESGRLGRLPVLIGFLTTDVRDALRISGTPAIVRVSSEPKGIVVEHVVVRDRRPEKPTGAERRER